METKQRIFAQTLMRRFSTHNPQALRASGDVSNSESEKEDNGNSSTASSSSSASSTTNGYSGKENGVHGDHSRMNGTENGEYSKMNGTENGDHSKSNGTVTMRKPRVDVNEIDR